MRLTYLCFFWFMYFVFSLSLPDHFAVAHVTPSVQPLCHDDERIALLQFKDSLIINKFASRDPSPYPKVASWNLEKENSNCCLWDGIKCSEETGHVIRLDLSNSCLSGSINSTSSLFHLVHLRWLSLADNDFNQSQIPSTIINLSRLSRLNLSMSGFSGQVPAELLELSKLVSLDLSYNDYLEIQRPGLGSLFDKLSNLKVLNLSYVNISSSIPHNLGNLSSLTYLSLASCQMQGPITPSICKLSKLVFLDIENNDFSEELPTFIGCLGSLEILDVSECNFSGRVPSSFSNLTQLSYLDLSDNNFLGQDSSSLSWIAKNSKLNKLGLVNMNLIGEIPSWLVNLTQLTKLYMGYNQLTGQIPSEMFELSKLVYLDISSNDGLELRGAGLRSLFEKLSNLEVLKLAYVNISSSIPHNLENLSSLTDFSLENCGMQGTIPSSICNLTKLAYLDLAYNNFSGELPTFIGCLGSLKELYIPNSNFSSRLPSSLSNLTQLNYLSLSSMNLTVQTTYPLFSSPDTVYGYSLTLNNKGVKLKYGKISNMFIGILLSNNKFTGEIPASIANLKGLQTLNLSYNDLQGHIPPSMGNLTALESLDLSYNKLSGEIPQQLAELTFLEVFNVSHNHLIGPVPWGKQFDTFDNTSFDGNPGLCGKLLSIKCGNYSEVPHKEDEDSESQFTIGWKIVLIGYVSGLIVGVVLGQEFYTRKHESFSKILGGKLKKNKRQRGRRN
ncbi:hypothetical protein JRO89_XS02G0122500 [Xanthoceras sorbifolium]|uniref:Leucine-rich repeat-containing N-terminal plant-type domain-containing protein n=1 Tax=Xanthoceras sorbifolium TaxID=99658 RepID=A0ABQ8IH12_9ROSI|nr:hypothetical protein JRO89_XS02G0122500 [Xanthoceras sorbifolium]